MKRYSLYSVAVVLLIALFWLACGENGGPLAPRSDKGISTPRVSHKAPTGAAKLSIQASGTGCVPPPSGLISWWPGDGNAGDIVGINHGTLQNGVTFAPGVVGQAFSFDGVDDFVQAPDSPNLRPTRITVDAWVFPQTFASHSDVFVARDGGTAGTRSWNFQAHHDGFAPACLNKPAFSMFIDGSNVFACGTTTLPLNQWSHLAATFDGSTIRIYVNGVLEGQSAAVGNLDAAVGTSLTIGALGGAFDFFKGLVDEVEVFSRALNASEITAIFTAGSAGKCKAIIQTVEIDIKPGSFPNSINRKSNGNVPVALLSSATFDATAADRSTVEFAGASPFDIGTSPEDVDGDGRLDVVFHFATQSLNLPDGTTEACLTGKTTSGQAFKGCDSVRLVK